jgi:hypothetical protein
MKPVLTEITANVESGKTQMYMAEWLVHKLFISALGVWILAIFCVTGEKSAVRYQIESANRDGFMGEGVMGGWIGGGDAHPLPFANRVQRCKGVPMSLSARHLDHARRSVSLLPVTIHLVNAHTPTV